MHNNSNEEQTVALAFSVDGVRKDRFRPDQTVCSKSIGRCRVIAVEPMFEGDPSCMVTFEHLRIKYAPPHVSHLFSQYMTDDLLAGDVEIESD